MAVNDWWRRNGLWRGYRVASLLFRTLLVMNRERTRVMRARERGDYEARPDIDALKRVLRDFRVTAIEMGGLLIKLGQFFGARADLLPQEALAELSALQDEVRPEPFPSIVKMLEKEYQAPLSEVFASVDPNPAGSASLGQVHRARLRDGRVIALKVQRPGIQRIVRVDLQALNVTLTALRWLAPEADRIIDLRALYREFSRTVYEELDYQREGRNAEHFAQLFANDDRIVVPKIYWDRSTRRALALEWVDGIKITNFAELDRAGLDRAALAHMLAESYFTQALDAGFFHADPHPGNIMAQPIYDEPGEARLVFVDFGMMGTITPRARRGLRACFAAMTQNDPALMIEGLDQLGFLAEEVDREALEQVIGTLLSRFTGVPLSQLGNMAGSDSALEDAAGILYDQPFRLPAQYAFFGRAVSMLSGLTAALTPNFNFLEVAAPHARKLLAEFGGGGIFSLLGAKNLEDLVQMVVRESISFTRSVTRLPRQLDRLIEQTQRGELRVIIEPTIEHERRRQRDRRNHRRERPSRLALLSRPVPLWAPLSIVGVAGISMAFMLARRGKKK